MRIALCLSGMSTGLNDKVVGGKMAIEQRGGQRMPVEWRTGLKHYRKHILSLNDVDVFIHTWGEGEEKEIREEYCPVSAQFEKQKQFDGGRKTRKHITLSRWYGVSRVCDLRKAYELEHGIKYDFVMLGRFDIAWQTDVLFDRFDPAYFYVGHWCMAYSKSGKILKPDDYYYKRQNEDSSVKHIHHGATGDLSKDNFPNPSLCDHWFFSSPDMIDEFSKIYEGSGRHLRQNRYPSSHSWSFKRLRQMGVLKSVRFAFHRNDDFPLVRNLYYRWRDKA